MLRWRATSPQGLRPLPQWPLANSVVNFFFKGQVHAVVCRPKTIEKVVPKQTEHKPPMCSTAPPSSGNLCNCSIVDPGVQPSQEPYNRDLKSS